METGVYLFVVLCMGFGMGAAFGATIRDNWNAKNIKELQRRHKQSMQQIKRNLSKV